MRRVDAVIMNGSGGEGGAVAFVDGARRALTLDLVDKVRAAAAFDSIVVSTNDALLVDCLAGTEVVVARDAPDEAFHFGAWLARLIDAHGMQGVVYLGGGCAPLLSVETLVQMAERLRVGDGVVLCNNFYSVDFCAFAPAAALLATTPPPTDNALGWTLKEEAGLRAEELPRSVATAFDVDTPTDLMALALHPDVTPRTRAYLAQCAPDTSRLERAIQVFVDRQGEALVAGRVGSRLLAYLERETACRTRVFSEERGMRADGRLARGEVRSLLGMHLEATGVTRFFADVIPQLGDAAFLDDRVMWAHHGVWPATGDRFSSDLMLPAEIADPYVRAFTEAAMACPVPVVLGGHSLVSGGLPVLVEAAWRRSGLDLQRPVASP
ncbi:MAG: hypothetical protein JXA09_12200 [Anaerolineae bacterium]|nr:hypothetical protein [Anaerolineae bacterium]